ncbi:hypothetical protein LXL04_029690 [Taraxacum kok-saghyz]
MESKTIIVCVIVAALGIAAATAGFAAEETKSKNPTLTVVYIGKEPKFECEYKSSPATGLAMAATVALVIARAFITSASGGCYSCCQTIRNLPRFARICVVISWYVTKATPKLIINLAQQNYSTKLRKMITYPTIQMTTPTMVRRRATKANGRPKRNPNGLHLQSSSSPPQQHISSSFRFLLLNSALSPFRFLPASDSHTDLATHVADFTPCFRFLPISLRRRGCVARRITLPISMEVGTLSSKKGVQSDNEGDYYCYIVRPGIFTGAAIMTLVSMVLALVYDLAFASATNLVIETSGLELGVEAQPVTNGKKPPITK